MLVSLSLVAGCQSPPPPVVASTQSAAPVTLSAATLAMLTPAPALRAVSAVQVLRHPPAPPAPPVTNVLITISNPNIMLMLSNSVDLIHWTWLGVLTNSSYRLPLSAPCGFIKGFVVAYPVAFTWTRSPDPAAGYELFYSPDGVGWLDYDLLPDTNAETEILQSPAATNFFTLATYGTNGDFSTNCNTTKVIVPPPTLFISTTNN